MAIRRAIAEKGLPVHMVKFVPGLGEQIDKLLYGDPVDAHSFVAEISHNILTLLEEDKAFDAIELTKQRALLEAQERADFRRAASATASGAHDAAGQDRQREEHATLATDETIPDHLRELTRVDHRQQAEVSSDLGSERNFSEQAL